MLTARCTPLSSNDVERPRAGAITSDEPVTYARDVASGLSCAVLAETGAEFTPYWGMGAPVLGSATSSVDAFRLSARRCSTTAELCRPAIRIAFLPRMRVAVRGEPVRRCTRLTVTSPRASIAATSDRWCDQATESGPVLGSVNVAVRRPSTVVATTDWPSTHNTCAARSVPDEPFAPHAAISADAATAEAALISRETSHRTESRVVRPG